MTTAELHQRYLAAQAATLAGDALQELDMRSIERRDTGESYEAFVRSLAEASGVETPTRADLARFDQSRKNKKTSNKEWKSPKDPDAKVAKMKDGRTHLAHKAEHGVDMDTRASTWRWYHAGVRALLLLAWLGLAAAYPPAARRLSAC